MPFQSYAREKNINPCLSANAIKKEKTGIFYTNLTVTFTRFKFRKINLLCAMSQSRDQEP